MKQILQSARTGRLELAEVPAPSPGPGQVLVRTHFSVVSPGTEKLALDFARSSMLGKARARPDLVRQVTRKLRQEGPLATYRAVRNSTQCPKTWWHGFRTPYHSSTPPSLRWAPSRFRDCDSRVRRSEKSGWSSGSGSLGSWPCSFCAQTVVACSA